MPLYEYRCRSCSRVFDAYKRLSEDKDGEKCPVCGDDAGRVGVSRFSSRGARSGSPSSSGSSCGGGPRRSPFR